MSRYIKSKKAGKYRSGFERSLALNLSKRKVTFDYEPFTIDYVIEHEYKPDFVLDNGIVIEAKGVLYPEDRRKMKAVRDQNPDKDIRFVFAKADKKLPGGKITHSEWAERNSFLWADGKVPVEWVNES